MSAEESGWRLVGPCCVCGLPVYREQNPMIGGEGCALRHRDCPEPKAKKERPGERP